MLKAVVSESHISADTDGALDGHAGKAGLASLVGAAKSAPLLDCERRGDNGVHVLLA